MLDFGLPELLMIVVVAVLVIGPSEIPKIMFILGRMVRRLQYMRFALSQQFDNFMQEHDLDEMRKDVDLRVVGHTDSEIEMDLDLDQENDSEKENKAKRKSGKKRKKQD